ncbi:winged helix domain-containing protein [Frigidibacter sp. MR17.24]|uniref:winged helix domain-containing protein n=1 Tax=Frigidibacter sp. MR17.24 TaxID=3127345 RepID=UPI003012B001
MSTSSNWGLARFMARNGHEPPFPIAVKGRVRWALEALLRAGPHGCTPISDPGPRWSAYIHDLRALGLSIETVNEDHGGPFAGRHARYVLASTVTPDAGPDLGGAHG